MLQLNMNRQLKVLLVTRQDMQPNILAVNTRRSMLQLNMTRQVRGLLVTRPNILVVSTRRSMLQLNMRLQLRVLLVIQPNLYQQLKVIWMPLEPRSMLSSKNVKGPPRQMLSTSWRQLKRGASMSELTMMVITLFKKLLRANMHQPKVMQQTPSRVTNRFWRNMRKSAMIILFLSLLRVIIPRRNMQQPKVVQRTYMLGTK
jgi:hypothetical protein